jgi:hypothetical protein
MRAFPSTDETTFDIGMSLRHYFAAKAMQALVTNADDYSDKRIAQLAYDLADAMVEAGRESDE